MYVHMGGVDPVSIVSLGEKAAGSAICGIQLTLVQRF
jgi:hypothetical protein